eukprot:1161897-Pelagomonas_calceolata.AAC.10
MGPHAGVRETTQASLGRSIKPVLISYKPVLKVLLYLKFELFTIIAAKKSQVMDSSGNKPRGVRYACKSCVLRPSLELHLFLLCIRGWTIALFNGCLTLVLHSSTAKVSTALALARQHQKKGHAWHLHTYEICMLLAICCAFFAFSCRPAPDHYTNGPVAVPHMLGQLLEVGQLREQVGWPVQPCKHGLMRLGIVTEGIGYVELNKACQRAEGTRLGQPPATDDQPLDGAGVGRQRGEDKHRSRLNSGVHKSCRSGVSARISPT